MYELEWIMFEHLVHCSKSLASSTGGNDHSFFDLRFSKSHRGTLISIVMASAHLSFPLFFFFQKNDKGESAAFDGFSQW
jgi:hypothetical protein